MPEEHRIIKNIVFRLVRKHIAGSTVNSALNTVRALNARGLGTTVTFLNEHVNDPVKARYNANAYVQVIRQISRLHLNSGISVRLSQIGFTVGNGVSSKGLEEIIEAAEQSSTMVWLESGPGITNDELLDVYGNCRSASGNIGVEIPISYYGQLGGIAKRLRSRDMVRLASHSYYVGEARKQKDDSGTLKRYLSSIEVLMKRSAKVWVHDPSERLVARIASSARSHKKDLIFEIPLGYNRKRAASLMKNRVNLDVYVPYGKDWAPYAIYRLSGGRIRAIASAVLNGQGRSDSNGKGQG